MTSNRMNHPAMDVPVGNGHGPVLLSPPKRWTSETSLEVPPLSEDDQNALADFQARQQALRDLTLGCIDGSHTGAYIYGPPGCGKSFVVLQTLRERKASWQLHQRITAKPLYLELEKHPGAVHVIEDCEQLFFERSAQTLLRSALGGERVKGRRERRVSYSVTGPSARVLEHYFYGSIIFTSNRPLANEKPEIRAVMSRIPCIGYAPTDHSIRALMRHVARQGHVGEAGAITPAECVEITEFVISLAAELQCHLDLRWIEHGYGHYLTQAESGGRVDWRDMVKFHVIRTLTFFDHTPAKGDGLGRDSTLASEIAVAREIAQTEGLSKQEQVNRWERGTGLSRATYYRRLAAGTDSAPG